MAVPIDPAFSVSGPEWSVGAVAGPDAAGAGAVAPAQGAGAGFADMLGSSIQSLTATQQDATQAAQDLATGQATDPTQVVMAVERAQLSMQLASQIRTKAIEAVQDIFHTQV
jgi:flagellar hook-basal body complex protein FliE